MEQQEQASAIRRKIFALFSEETRDKGFPKYFNYFIMTLILVNVVSMILETVKSVYEPYHTYFHAFELFVIAVFTCEYIMRILTADLAFPCGNRLRSILKYMFSFYGLIDLLAILPFYMPFTKLDLRIVRTLRLLRFLRLFKITRYNNSMELIKSVMSEKRSELGVTCFVILIVMIIASFLMFYAENAAQPDHFPNVLACIWWSIVTLTTVGYGDVFPVTGIGRFIGGVIAFLGIGLVALPTGIISAGFLEKLNEKNKDQEPEKEPSTEHHDGEKCHKQYCPYCGHKLDE